MRHCYLLRVFTRGDDGGNPLGVVTDVTGLESDRMQRIAFDLGFSETVFIDWRSGGVPHARIFTPAAELPFAGHPLVGAAWVLGVIGPGSAQSIMCEVGEVAFTIDDETVWILAPSGQPVRPSEVQLEGLTPLHLETVAMPLPYHLAQFEDPETVQAIEGPPRTGSIYTWAWVEEGAVVKARFFAADVGIDEDPATGSAAVALAAALRERGMERGDLEVRQGDEIGAPSTIQLRWTPEWVEVGGQVRRDEVRVLGQ